MTSIRESIKRLIESAKPLQPGIYHYQAPPDDPRNFRLHLRIESEGSALLIVNASTILHLNRTAAEYAYHLVNQTPQDVATKEIASRYRVNQSKVKQDYQDFVDRIDLLVSTPDLDPITVLDLDRQSPYSGDISAPYRLDCAITYRLPETSDPDAAPTKRVTRELTTEEWKTIFDKAWSAGIPHIIITGGEPTLREDLPELVAHAEKNGQVTGLLTDGMRLADKIYLNTLLQTGLDHLLIMWHLEEDSTWKVLENALAEDLFTAVHITLTDENRDRVPQVIMHLAKLQVGAISLSAAPGLLEALTTIREQVAELNISLIWDLPVPYSPINPVSMEVELEDNSQGAGKAWLYVEPDGDVLPAQGINQVLGNFLTDPWEKIWR
jgi:organic radical activating enzyme